MPKDWSNSAAILKVGNSVYKPFRLETNYKTKHLTAEPLRGQRIEENSMGLALLFHFCHIHIPMFNLIGEVLGRKRGRIPMNRWKTKSKWDWHRYSACWYFRFCTSRTRSKNTSCSEKNRIPKPLNLQIGLSLKRKQLQDVKTLEPVNTLAPFFFFPECLAVLTLETNEQ